MSEVLAVFCYLLVGAVSTGVIVIVTDYRNAIRVFHIPVIILGAFAAPLTAFFAVFILIATGAMWILNGITRFFTYMSFDKWWDHHYNDEIISFGKINETNYIREIYHDDEL